MYHLFDVRSSLRLTVCHRHQCPFKGPEFPRESTTTYAKRVKSRDQHRQSPFLSFLRAQACIISIDTLD